MFKYIIFECEANARQTVRIFDVITDHSQVAREIAATIPGFKPISAGKITFKDKKVICSKGSVTLNIKGNLKESLEDVETIRKLMEIY